jgi:cytochrome c-type biogenesis protein CcmH/NrfG
MEMAGSLAYETADYAAAALHWRQLLATLPEGQAAHRELSAAIARADKLAETKANPALSRSRALLSSR